MKQSKDKIDRDCPQDPYGKENLRDKKQEMKKKNLFSIRILRQSLKIPVHTDLEIDNVLKEV